MFARTTVTSLGCHRCALCWVKPFQLNPLNSTWPADGRERSHRRLHRFNAYLKAHPTNAAAWIKRGNVAALADDVHAALADYDMAEKNGVPAAILTYRRARSYMNLLNTEAAFTQLELAMSNGVSLSTKLDDEVFDPIPPPRFKAIHGRPHPSMHRRSAPRRP
jgi:hypothetical protein